MKLLLVVVVFVALAAPALAAQYCAADTDCSDFGDLKCIFSKCPGKGICGCARNQVAKWMGSTLLYQCVPLRKVGQRCSNLEPTGACGAPGSFCNESMQNGKREGWCECRDGYLPEHGGESCTSLGNSVSHSIVGETRPEFGSCSVSGDLFYSPVLSNTHTCACDDDEKLVLDYSSTTPFTDRLQPICIPKVVGDACKQDSECTHISTSYAVCDAGICQCNKTNSVKKYKGNGCLALTNVLSYGDDCTGDICNGNLGLVCGDMCDWVAPSTEQCKCGPGHRTSGTTCTVNKPGDPCSGDANCNHENRLAICVDGICVDGSQSIGKDLGVLDEENSAVVVQVTWYLMLGAVLAARLS